MHGSRRRGGQSKSGSKSSKTSKSSQQKRRQKHSPPTTTSTRPISALPLVPDIGSPTPTIGSTPNLKASLSQPHSLFPTPTTSLSSPNVLTTQARGMAMKRRGSGNKGGGRGGAMRHEAMDMDQFAAMFDMSPPGSSRRGSKGSRGNQFEAVFHMDMGGMGQGRAGKGKKGNLSSADERFLHSTGYDSPAFKRSKKHGRRGGNGMYDMDSEELEMLFGADGMGGPMDFASFMGMDIDSDAFMEGYQKEMKAQRAKDKGQAKGDDGSDESDENERFARFETNANRRSSRRNQRTQGGPEDIEDVLFSMFGGDPSGFGFGDLEDEREEKREKRRQEKAVNSKRIMKTVDGVEIFGDDSKVNEAMSKATVREAQIVEDEEGPIEAEFEPVGAQNGQNGQKFSKDGQNGQNSYRPQYESFGPDSGTSPFGSSFRGQSAKLRPTPVRNPNKESGGKMSNAQFETVEDFNERTRQEEAWQRTFEEGSRRQMEEVGHGDVEFEPQFQFIGKQRKMRDEGENAQNSAQNSSQNAQNAQNSAQNAQNPTQDTAQTASPSSNFVDADGFDVPHPDGPQNARKARAVDAEDENSTAKIHYDAFGNATFARTGAHGHTTASPEGQRAVPKDWVGSNEEQFMKLQEEIERQNAEFLEKAATVEKMKIEQEAKINPNSIQMQQKVRYSEQIEKSNKKLQKMREALEEEEAAGIDDEVRKARLKDIEDFENREIFAQNELFHKTKSTLLNQIYGDIADKEAADEWEFETAVKQHKLSLADIKSITMMNPGVNKTTDFADAKNDEFSSNFSKSEQQNASKSKKSDPSFRRGDRFRTDPKYGNAELGFDQGVGDGPGGSGDQRWGFNANNVKIEDEKLNSLLNSYNISYDNTVATTQRLKKMMTEYHEIALEAERLGQGVPEFNLTRAMNQIKKEMYVESLKTPEERAVMREFGNIAKHAYGFNTVVDDGMAANQEQFDEGRFRTAEDIVTNLKDTIFSATKPISIPWISNIISEQYGTVRRLLKHKRAAGRMKEDEYLYQRAQLEDFMQQKDQLVSLFVQKKTEQNYASFLKKRVSEGLPAHLVGLPEDEIQMELFREFQESQIEGVVTGDDNNKSEASAKSEKSEKSTKSSTTAKSSRGREKSEELADKKLALENLLRQNKEKQDLEAKIAKLNQFPSAAGSPSLSDEQIDFRFRDKEYVKRYGAEQFADDQFDRLSRHNRSQKAQTLTRDGDNYQELLAMAKGDEEMMAKLMKGMKKQQQRDRMRAKEGRFHDFDVDFNPNWTLDETQTRAERDQQVRRAFWEGEVAKGAQSGQNGEQNGEQNGQNGQNDAQNAQKSTKSTKTERKAPTTASDFDRERTERFNSLWGSSKTKEQKQPVVDRARAAADQEADFEAEYGWDRPGQKSAKSAKNAKNGSKNGNFDEFDLENDRMDSMLGHLFGEDSVNQRTKQRSRKDQSQRMHDVYRPSRKFSTFAHFDKNEQNSQDAENFSQNSQNAQNAQNSQIAQFSQNSSNLHLTLSTPSPLTQPSRSIFTSNHNTRMKFNTVGQRIVQSAPNFFQNDQNGQNSHNFQNSQNSFQNVQNAQNLTSSRSNSLLHDATSPSFLSPHTSSITPSIHNSIQRYFSAGNAKKGKVAKMVQDAQNPDVFKSPIRLDSLLASPSHHQKQLEGKVDDKASVGRKIQQFRRAEVQQAIAQSKVLQAKNAISAQKERQMANSGLNSGSSSSSSGLKSSLDSLSNRDHVRSFEKDQLSKISAVNGGGVGVQVGGKKGKHTIPPEEIFNVPVKQGRKALRDARLKDLGQYQEKHKNKSKGQLASKINRAIRDTAINNVDGSGTFFTLTANGNVLMKKKQLSGVQRARAVAMKLKERNQDFVSTLNGRYPTSFSEATKVSPNAFNPKLPIWLADMDNDPFMLNQHWSDMEEEEDKPEMLQKAEERARAARAVKREKMGKMGKIGQNGQIDDETFDALSDLDFDDPSIQLTEAQKTERAFSISKREDERMMGNTFSAELGPLGEELDIDIDFGPLSHFNTDPTALVSNRKIDLIPEDDETRFEVLFAKAVIKQQVEAELQLQNETKALESPDGAQDDSIPVAAQASGAGKNHAESHTVKAKQGRDTRFDVIDEILVDGPENDAGDETAGESEIERALERLLKQSSNLGIEAIDDSHFQQAAAESGQRVQNDQNLDENGQNDQNEQPSADPPTKSQIVEKLTEERFEVAMQAWRSKNGFQKAVGWQSQQEQLEAFEKEIEDQKIQAKIDLGMDYISELESDADFIDDEQVAMKHKYRFGEDNQSDDEGRGRKANKNKKMAQNAKKVNFDPETGLPDPSLDAAYSDSHEDDEYDEEDEMEDTNNIYLPKKYLKLYQQGKYSQNASRRKSKAQLLEESRSRSEWNRDTDEFYQQNELLVMKGFDIDDEEGEAELSKRLDRYATVSAKFKTGRVPEAPLLAKRMAEMEAQEQEMEGVVGKKRVVGDNFEKSDQNEQDDQNDQNSALDLDDDDDHRFDDIETEDWTDEYDDDELLDDMLLDSEDDLQNGENGQFDENGEKRHGTTRLPVNDQNGVKLQPHTHFTTLKNRRDVRNIVDLEQLAADLDQHDGIGADGLQDEEELGYVKGHQAANVASGLAKPTAVAKIIGGERFYTFELHEDDLDEHFVRGTGPGGQAVNKTKNCVVLQHKPTSTVVKCHQTRELHRNRAIARKIMRRKLEALFKGKDSYLGRKIERLQKKKQKAARRQKASDKYSSKRDDEIARLRAKLGIEPETTAVAPGMNNNTNANSSGAAAAAQDGGKGKKGKGKKDKAQEKALEREQERARAKAEFTDDDGNVEIVKRTVSADSRDEYHVRMPIAMELNPDIANIKLKM